MKNPENPVHEDQEARRDKALALCNRLSCAPRHIFDFQMYALFNSYCLVPQQVEKLLEQRGFRVKDEESLCDKITELYGEDTAKLMEELI